MGGPLPRPTALNARLDLTIEEWPYLDEAVLLMTRSRKVCMTCHWFRHHAGVNCIPVHTCQLNQGLIAHGEHLTSRRPPHSPKEDWLIQGSQVLRFRPTGWDRTGQRLELISPDLAIDLDLRRKQTGRLSADGGGARR